MELHRPRWVADRGRRVRVGRKLPEERCELVALARIQSVLVGQGAEAFFGERKT